MPVHAIQTNFSGGEISPHLYSRAAAEGGNAFLKTACNFFVHPQGGASNRPGTAFVREAKYADKDCRLIPFVLSEEEAYVLEIGHEYMRVHAQAGTLLDADGDPYELTSPYGETDLPSLSYVQYDQALFLVHPDYYPKKLTRTDDGYFSLQDMTIKDGPFMVANTDESKKVRLVSESGTVVSEGVKAVLSFLPVSYPNYFIQAFWQGERFYDPSGYGFNVGEVVLAFNNKYSSTGCVAYNQGGVIRIESPQATGGDYNGAQLTIHYREGIVAPPVLIVTQSMSGGCNAGEIISQGETKYYLEANTSLFRPGQAGALFALRHRVESPYESGTLGYEDTSKVIKTGGDWSFRTTGSWYGEIVLEASEDNAAWEKVKHFTKAQDEDNFSTVGSLELSAKMHYLRLRCLGISGEMGYVLQAEAFSQEGIVKLQNYVSATKMQVSIERQAGEENEWTDDWSEGSFSPEAGYPRCVFFYQDRLGFAGTKKEPQTVWFSKTGEHEDFGYLRTLEDSDSISVNLSGKKLNAISSVAVGSRLLLFTAGSEWSLGCSGALTPYNIEIHQEGERGASGVPPIVVGNRTLYVQSRGSVLRDFFYQYSSASYTGRDLTLRARHLFFNKEIKEMAYQQEPDNLIWCVMSDGGLLSLTYLAEEDLFAWTRHETQGQFLSVCSIPSRGYDETWFLVRRGEKCFVERLLPRLSSKEPEDQIFLDCSVSKKSTVPFSEVEGLAHLNGQSVCVLADGSPLTGLTVSNGKITLPSAVYTVHAGLAYEAVLQTLPADYTLPDGTVQDRKRRPVQVMLKVMDSRGGKIGAGEGKLDLLVNDEAQTYGSAAPLQTRDFIRQFSASHNYFPSVTFVQSDPLPVTLLAVITRLN